MAGREESNHSAPMHCVRHRTDGDAHGAIKSYFIHQILNGSTC
jgi:hypothetical protein